jgi:hypothetical protein
MKRLRQWSFRQLWENICFLTLNDPLRAAMTGADLETEGANGVLAWCYVATDGAMSFALLAPASGYKSGQAEPLAAPVTIRASLARWQVLDCGCFVYPPEAYAAFAPAIEAFAWTLHTSPDLQGTRRLRKLDPYRNRAYPDEIPVLVVYHFHRCSCPVRCRRLEDDRVWGLLAAEPDLDVGIHEGDEVSFPLGTDLPSGCSSQLSFVAQVSPDMVAQSRRRRALEARFKGKDALRA